MNFLSKKSRKDDTIYVVQQRTTVHIYFAEIFQKCLILRTGCCFQISMGILNESGLRVGSMLLIFPTVTSSGVFIVNFEQIPHIALVFLQIFVSRAACTNNQCLYKISFQLLPVGLDFLLQGDYT